MEFVLCFCKRSKYLVLGPIDPIELPGTGICTVFFKGQARIAGPLIIKILTINVSSFEFLIFPKKIIEKYLGKLKLFIRKCSCKYVSKNCHHQRAENLR